jgi:hypothetical protein
MVQSQPEQRVCETLPQKNPIYKNRAGGVAQVVECLPSKREADTVPPKKKKNQPRLVRFL